MQNSDFVRHRREGQWNRGGTTTQTSCNSCATGGVGSKEARDLRWRLGMVAHNLPSGLAQILWRVPSWNVVAHDSRSCGSFVHNRSSDTILWCDHNFQKCEDLGCVWCVLSFYAHNWSFLNQFSVNSTDHFWSLCSINWQFEELSPTYEQRMEIGGHISKHQWRFRFLQGSWYRIQGTKDGTLPSVMSDHHQVHTRSLFQTQTDTVQWR